MMWLGSQSDDFGAFVFPASLSNLARTSVGGFEIHFISCMRGLVVLRALGGFLETILQLQ
jgi:hypothetical protein